MAGTAAAGRGRQPGFKRASRGHRRRARTVGYRGQVRTREGREAVGKNGGQARHPGRVRVGARGAAAGPGRAAAAGQQRAGTRPPPSQGHRPPGGSPAPAGPPPLPPLRQERAGGRGVRPSSPCRGPTRPGGKGPEGQRYLTAPGAIPLPRRLCRLPPHRRAAAGPAPRPCPRGRRGGRRGVPCPPTSPFVSGCSSSVRLGLATRVSLAGREAEVLQQQLLNRQWLPWLPPPPPSGAGGRRGRGAPALRGQGGRRAGGGAPAPELEEGIPAATVPRVACPVPPPLLRRVLGREERGAPRGGRRKCLMETRWKVICRGVKGEGGGGITALPGSASASVRELHRDAVEAGGWERGQAPSSAFFRGERGL